MKIVFYGLTITSSWGNGHATTYRSLCKALAARGHRIDFVEKDVEWYRSNRDLPAPPYCRVHLYDSWEASADKLLTLARDADAIVIGSYFPDAIVATRALLDADCGPPLFYDIDTPITLSHLRAQRWLRVPGCCADPALCGLSQLHRGPCAARVGDVFRLTTRRAVLLFGRCESVCSDACTR